jgi:vancomycin resistance protein YoaR
VLVAVVVVLWVVDGQAHKGVVARNVALVDRNIGGMDRQEVDAAVAALSARYASAEVEVDAPDGGFKAGAAELGLSVQGEATVEAALDIDHEGFFVTRIWNWATGFVVSRKTPVVLDVDENAVRRLVAERDPLRQPPVEPDIELRDGRVVAVEGKAGRGIDPVDVVQDLRAGAGQRFPLRASVPRTEVPPRYTVADAERVAAEAEALAVNELPVVIEGVAATVPAATVRTWLRAVPADTGLRLGIDTEGAAEALSTIFPEAGRPAIDAGLAVAGGEVVVTPSQTGTACCAPEAATAIENALRNRRAGDPPVDLPLKIVPPSRTEEQVRALGIVEVIGSFTTNHPAGEPRVTNIHRIADLVQGAIIEPGGTFSLNGHVGARTIDKGFVEAPVIDAEYKFSKDVGGGVSQFSTTLFNAAFFAGLDIPTYGMHGIYIARYPYGREATLDFPSLDLKVHNPTPHGVLIWPSYGSSSITVTLYSTRTVEGAQTGQTKDEIETTQVKPTVTTAPADPDPSAPTTEAPPVTEPPAPQRYVCTRVTTERTRTYTDGRTAVDRFYALYAPEEGIICPR